MADAMAAYRTAFSSFRRHIVDYTIYSLIFSAVSAVMGVIVILAFLVFGMVSAGALIDLISSGNVLSLAALGTGLVLLLMLAGLLIFVLLQGGLLGAYLETVGGLLSDRKQSLGGFVSAVPRHAASMLAAFLLVGIVSCIPAAIGLAVASLLGFSTIPGIAVAILGVFLTYLVSLLFIFVPPAVAVERRGPVDAMKSSVARIIQHPVAFVIFLVLSALLAIPSITLIYIPFVLLPVGQAALIAFHKR
jgi:hypothetical protein